MDGLIAVVAFGALVVVIAVIGVRLGMLVAPRIDRLASRAEEEPRADDD